MVGKSSTLVLMTLQPQWCFFILLQVCSPLPCPLPLLQRLFQSQETAGEDAADSVGATRPQRCLLLVRVLHESIHV